MSEKKQELTLYQSLKNELTTDRTSLPKDLNIERFANNALAVLNGNENLQKFYKENGKSQIVAGLMKGAYLGLDFMSQEAYLVPFGKTLNFMKSYTGAIKLCKKYSIRPLKDIYAKLVREGDEYSIEIINNEPKITFKPLPFNDGAIKGAFAVALFTDGGIQYEEMSLKELEKVRSCSKQKSGTVWQMWTNQMYLKTILHRLCKKIEIDFDNAEQQKYFNEEMEIETDVKAQAANDIAENANKADLDDENIIEVVLDESTQTIVEDSGQQSFVTEE